MSEYNIKTTAYYDKYGKLLWTETPLSRLHIIGELVVQDSIHYEVRGVAISRTSGPCSTIQHVNLIRK